MSDKLFFRIQRNASWDCFGETFVKATRFPERGQLVIGSEQ